MWLATDQGYFSTVESKDDPNRLVVRARVRGDLENLVVLLPDPMRVTGESSSHRIIDGGGTDYPYRLVVSRSDWSYALVQFAERIDYTNFKDAVEERQGGRRHDVYLRVWSALKSLDYVRGGRRDGKRRRRR